jgi:hypothetical protein
MAEVLGEASRLAGAAGAQVEGAVLLIHARKK